MKHHLESARRIHLALVCIKLNKTEDELNNTKALLNETRVELKKMPLNCLSCPAKNIKKCFFGALTVSARF